jgi:hypothetical protein
VSIFVDSSHLDLLVAISGMAVVSGLVLVESIQEEDSPSAWVWGTVFGVSSLGAWSFWRLV